MSAVDVLAVMNTGAGHLYREAGRVGGEKLSAEMMEARAAVAALMAREAVQAELIADLRAQCVRNLELGAYGVAYWEDSLESIDAALARCKGEG